MAKKYDEEAKELWNYVTNAAIDSFNGDIDKEACFTRAEYFTHRLESIINKAIKENEESKVQ